MGNRAVISFTQSGYANCKAGTLDTSQVGLYLHWNGGLESIEAFCKAATDLEISDPARFIQMVANWFGGNQSVYVDVINNLDYDNYDNGAYVLSKSSGEWKVVQRAYVPEHLIGCKLANHDQIVQEMSHDVFTKSVTHFMKGEGKC